MAILVTGCAGFIGSCVTRVLLQQGWSVYGVDSFAVSGAVELQRRRLDSFLDHPSFHFQQADISDQESLKPLFLDSGPAGPVSGVINLGALAGVRSSVRDPRSYYQANLLGTLSLLELCREFSVYRFLLASTSSVYGGDTNGKICEDAVTDHPLSPYAASKKAAENLLYTYHYLHGVNATVLRFFTVYGPEGRPDMSVFKFIRATVENEPITVFGDGTQRRDFTYVDDIANGTVAALGLTGYRVINLGNDRPVAINDVIAMVEATVGRKAKIEYGERHAADPMLTWADISLARKLLGWEPTVSIEDGIRRTVKWYMANRHWASKLV